MAAPTTIDEYLAGFPDDKRAVLQQMRERILSVRPDAVEMIKYGMPTFEMPNGYRMYFAGWAKHIGVYPVPRGDDDFETAVAPYRHAKDTVRFALREPVPRELVDRITAHIAARRAS
ncbi:iron chaperone [Schumannella sp. 10F1B-5-1]|uniref:iron chaperone n=1 Tax=Schumannella sp. 10F1B-5-1 TaxID=2590780 RepID=UPI0011300C07|nr:DUF1801 domain-containing protein [Schumannella sp. 10F1B-5-1]TPW70177.1 DUF1801 domain-containing protein [Schumannella sp. 10F1B-5-1]